MHNANFLDKTFNLAGFFRGLMGGILLSVIITFILVLLRVTAPGIFYLAFFIIFPIAGAFAGLREKSVDHNSKVLNFWLKFSRAIFFLNLFSGKIVPADSVIPEKITVRRFLIWLFIIVVLVIIFWYYAPVRTWWEAHTY